MASQKLGGLGRKTKKASMVLQPDIYLEPKWLRCLLLLLSVSVITIAKGSQKNRRANASALTIRRCQNNKAKVAKTKRHESMLGEKQKGLGLAFFFFGRKVAFIESQ